MLCQNSLGPQGPSGLGLRSQQQEKLPNHTLSIYQTEIFMGCIISFKRRSHLMRKICYQRHWIIWLTYFDAVFSRRIIIKDSILKSREITFPTKVHIASHGFCSGCVQLWEPDYKVPTQSWVPKNWGFQTVVLEGLLRDPCTTRSTPSIKGHGGWDAYRENLGNLHYHTLNRWPRGICSKTQGTQTGALW